MDNMNHYSNKAYHHYQASNVALSSPEGLIALLYSELLFSLILSKEAFLIKDSVAMNKNISKSVEILVELMGSLNIEKGETIALNLAVLYEYIAGKLLTLRCQPNIALFNEVIQLITPLKEAWEKITTPDIPQKMAMK